MKDYALFVNGFVATYKSSLAAAIKEAKMLQDNVGVYVIHIEAPTGSVFTLEEAIEFEGKGLDKELH